MSHVGQDGFRQLLPRHHQTNDLPITRRMLGVGLVGSRRIEPAHVGWPVGLDGSRRIQKDRLDDQTDDQGLSDRIGCQGKQVSPRATDDQGASGRKSDAAFAMTPGPGSAEVRSDQNKDRGGSREQ
jgi:hypothetical protein